MKARAPSPRLGDAILLVTGDETMILAYALYQPKAPKAFEVTDKAGAARVVQWNGQLWAEIGAAPVLAQLVKNNLSSGDDEAGKPLLRVGQPRERESLLTSGLRVSKVQCRAVPLLNSISTPPRAKAESVARRSTATGEAAPSPEAATATSELAVLDVARGQKWSSPEAMERYHAAILEVDRVDPGFYLGRGVRVLAVLPRYVPPFADPLAVCRSMLAGTDVEAA